MTVTKPTILHVIDTTGPGGAETVFLDLAENLEVNGYSNLALIKGPGWVKDQLELREIPYVVESPRGFLSIPYYVKLIRMMHRRKVKIVQAHLLGSALTFSVIHFFTGIPVIATLHGQVDVNQDERFIRIKKFLLRVGISRVIAVSGELAKYLVERKLFSNSQIEVIHNGIDVEKYIHAGVCKKIQDLNFPDEAVLIGSLGNIRPAKDYQTLIRAARHVVDQNSNAQFVIGGHAKQPLKNELDSLVKNLNLEENVHFLGFIDDTASFFNSIHIFALSSKVEGFSIATIEALASKTPVVCTLCGGPEEIIRNGKEGVLVPVCDDQALANGICALVNQAQCRQYTERGFNRVVENFSLKSLLIKYRQLLMSLL